MKNKILKTLLMITTTFFAALSYAQNPVSTLLPEKSSDALRVTWTSENKQLFQDIGFPLDKIKWAKTELGGRAALITQYDLVFHYLKTYSNDFQLEGLRDVLQLMEEIPYRTFYKDGGLMSLHFQGSHYYFNKVPGAFGETAEAVEQFDHYFKQIASRLYAASKITTESDLHIFRALSQLKNDFYYGPRSLVNRYGVTNVSNVFISFSQNPSRRDLLLEVVNHVNINQNSIPMTFTMNDFESPYAQLAFLKTNNSYRYTDLKLRVDFKNIDSAEKLQELATIFSKEPSSEELLMKLRMMTGANLIPGNNCSEWFY